MFRKTKKSLDRNKKHALTYDTARTFDDLCTLGALWADNDRKESMGNADVRTGVNLYEMTDGLDWIRPIVSFLNRKGWLSNMTQPGKLFPARLFKTDKDFTAEANRQKTAPYDFNPQFNSATMVRGKYSLIQRAYYGGFMSKRLANRVEAALSDDVRLVLIRSDKPKQQAQVVRGCLKYMTVYAKNGVPMCKESEAFDAMPEEEQVRAPLLRSTYFSALGELSDLKTEMPHFRENMSDFTMVAVMDKHWNDNAYMWTKLVQVFSAL